MMATDFTILAVVQGGRLEYEALLFMASLRASGNHQRVVLAEPQPGPLWVDDPRIGNPSVRAKLLEMGAEIVPLHSQHFGSGYPYGNKIEAIALLPEHPFIFFDTDTIFLGELAQVPFDFDRPTASLRREGTWPKALPGWPGHARVWRSLYERLGLDFASSQDLNRAADDWQRYLYFNAGFFFHRSPQEFGGRFLHYAMSVRDDPPAELAGQKLTPWLDQIVLPLVIHSFGGGVDALPNGLLDGSVTCHYRTPSLLYARENEQAIAAFEGAVGQPGIRKLLQQSPTFYPILHGDAAQKIRAMFADKTGLESEAFYRKKLKSAGLWLR